MALESLAKGVVRTLCWLLAGVVVAHGDPIPLNSVEASFQGGGAAALAKVIDGVEAGPEGWSVGPKFSEPQTLIVQCGKTVVAKELDISLFFLSGQPGASIAEFELAYTTDDEPSLKGNWKPLAIKRAAGKIATLNLHSQSRVRTSSRAVSENGVIPGDTYRISIQLPGNRATGFRLQVFPVLDKLGKPFAMSWSHNHDFVLTEFRVEEPFFGSTNLALNRPVRSSHPVQLNTTPGFLTDGVPTTFTHPSSGNLGAQFHFDIDLGQSAAFDHINLHGRSDNWVKNRLSRVNIRLYEHDPEMGATPVWEGIDRADGSSPAPGEHDVIHAGLGKGDFRGRYLRLSSDSPVPYSPQLGEVEVYESRTPELVAVLANGRKTPANGELNLPFEDRRLSIHLKIPQAGMPAGDLFRWRIRGGSEEWQTSRSLTIDMPCPPRGQTFFEAQALHSDREWDATVFSLPIIRKRLWETSGFQVIAAVATVLGTMSLTRFVTKRRSARKLALAKARVALAEERTRIARDMHDDIGARLTHIALLADAAERAVPGMRDIAQEVRETIGALDQIVWAINPRADTVGSFAEYLSIHAARYLDASGIRLRQNIDIAARDHALGFKTRHSLIMACKEALQNITKHSGAREARLEITVADGALTIIFADDGRGLGPVVADIDHSGLDNMRERLAECGGTCIIESPPAGGVRVIFQLPPSRFEHDRH
jgi:signal transduction histidine kinase